MVQRKRLESLLALITGLLLLAARTSFALVVRNRPTSPCLLSLSTPKAACRNCGRPLFATTDDSSDERELTPTERILENEKLDPATRAVVEAAVKRKQVVDLEPKKYPIDLPSPILLATSMILAIVSTGTLKNSATFVHSETSVRVACTLKNVSFTQALSLSCWERTTRRLDSPSLRPFLFLVVRRPSFCFPRPLTKRQQRPTRMTRLSCLGNKKIALSFCESLIQVDRSMLQLLINTHQSRNYNF